MLIHFETKRRWNITISTTRHKLVEETTGPGARSCTCRRSSFAGQVDSDKDSSVRRCPTDIAGDESRTGDWVPVLRCRNFFRKIHRFSIEIHRMYPHQYADATPDEPPPPYEYQQVHELPASSIHELPDSRILAPELEGQHGFAELESPMEQSSYDALYVGLGPRFYSCSSESNEHVATADRMVLRQTPSFELPRLSWSQGTQQHFGAAPSMTSSEQSHKSSPISPLTPVGNGDYSTQLHSNTDLTPDSMSPLDSISPLDSSWEVPDLFGMGCDYAPHTNPLTLLDAGSLESVGENVQYSQAQRFDVQPDSRTRSAAQLPSASQGSYISDDQRDFAGDDSLPESRAQYCNTQNIRLGVYEYGINLGWLYRGICGQDATEDGDAEHMESTADPPGLSQNTPHSDEGQRPLCKYIELYDHQAPEVDMVSRADKINYPPEHCGQCGKMFNGRYRKGNLRRHVLSFHRTMAVVVGTACRICKKAYKRADATRKHEWNKHSIPDTKPKKRAK